MDPKYQPVRRAAEAAGLNPTTIIARAKRLQEGSEWIRQAVPGLDGRNRLMICCREDLLEGLMEPKRASRANRTKPSGTTAVELLVEIRDLLVEIRNAVRPERPERVCRECYGDGELQDGLCRECRESHERTLATNYQTGPRPAGFSYNVYNMKG
jgi:hypothetical protein